MKLTKKQIDALLELWDEQTAIADAASRTYHDVTDGHSPIGESEIYNAGWESGKAVGFETVIRALFGKDELYRAIAEYDKLTEARKAEAERGTFTPLQTEKPVQIVECAGCGVEGLYEGPLPALILCPSCIESEKVG